MKVIVTQNGNIRFPTSSFILKFQSVKRRLVSKIEPQCCTFWPQKI